MRLTPRVSARPRSSWNRCSSSTVTVSPEGSRTSQVPATLAGMIQKKTRELSSSMWIVLSACHSRMLKSWDTTRVPGRSSRKSLGRSLTFTLERR